MITHSVTAAILVIGDEILSGRTKDRNIGYIAEYLTKFGVSVREVRVVPDVEEEIVAALNALRSRYTYVLTTGGIGPTHDDITADAVAKAFGVEIGEDERALAALREMYAPADLTPARRRMARIPHGAALIANPLTKAPGFRVENVIVMAGVPSIMQVMLDNAISDIKGGAVMLSAIIETENLPEGRYADPLRAIAQAQPEVSIGSYPAFRDGKVHNQIILRALDPAVLEDARKAVQTMLDTLKQG